MEILLISGISGAGKSVALRVLEDADLVQVRREGTRRLYLARPDKLDELRRYLDAFWASGLERLTVAAEAEERRLQQHGDTER